MSPFSKNILQAVEPATYSRISSNLHFSDRYKLPEQVEHNLVNGYYVPHTYDGEKASGKTVYVSQFPLYFESQGVVDNYARCHALDEDREKIISEFGEAAD